VVQKAQKLNQDTEKLNNTASNQWGALVKTTLKNFTDSRQLKAL
jgi:hypothetical protein